MYLTTKLHWRKHIEYLLSKATNGLHFLKIVSKYVWGQDTAALLTSKLTYYGQEVYCSAPKIDLKKAPKSRQQSCKTGSWVACSCINNIFLHISWNPTIR